MFVEETRRSAEMQREIRIHRASGDRNETGKDHEGSALRWDSDRIMYRFCSAGGCVLVAASRPQAHRVPFVPLIVNETILSIYIKRQRCQRKTARPQIANPANAGYVNPTAHLVVRRSSNESSQYSPYQTPSASGGPSVLTRSLRRRHAERPQLYEPFVANPTASAGNEASSAVLEVVRRYLCTRGLDLKVYKQPAHGN